ncbi:MAG: winged helix-turn-helix transcriptional regulator [Armatimonadetes bacterium]|nr:winged helix-turn-helix transcriptional regulator [Armatimonadota bacterium]
MDSKKNVTETHYTLGALLRRPYDALAAEVYQGIEDSGHPAIRPAHGRVFRHILPSGSRAVDLARAAGMTKQSMAALVEDLDKAGYVALVPDPSDGRAKLVQLTAEGEKVQAEIIRRSAEVESRWASELGEEQWQSMREALRLLFDHLEPTG